ncbi:RNA polymerase sigma factor [Enterococcus sp. LJL51]|uniref:RNA polymerase sigma factor n=1 Tax=Enterococcus sp. LJL51 TaxID=3416656 RepID=UPI003CE6739A
MDEWLLIYYSKKGDRRALNELIENYYQDIYRYCYRRCFGNQGLAEEITQEVFLRLVHHIKSYRFTGKFRNYLFTIAVNLCTNTLAKKQLPNLSIDTELLAADVSTNPVEQTLESEKKLIIKGLIDELPPIQKDVIILRYYHNLRLKDIAQILEIPLSTVKSRLKQGQIKIKSRLEEENL